MNLGLAHGLFTLWVLVSFILVLYVVLSKRNKSNYEDVASTIIEDPDTPDANSSHNHGAK